MFEKKSEIFLRSAKSNLVHNEAVVAAENYSDAESYLYLVIEVVDDRKIYEDCELTSLYQYCTKILNLSESISYSLIAVVRKGREVTQLKEAVLSGKVTLSKAKKICSVINEKNFSEWIELAASETSRVIEKCVAQANPKESVKESLKYVSSDRIDFRLGVSEEFVSFLEKAKDLLSQKQSKPIGSEEVLLVALSELVERYDPVKKAERALKREEKKLRARLVPGTVVRTESSDEVSKPNQVTKLAKRQNLKGLTVHKIKLRDGQRCTYEFSDGGRCDNKRWLDVHHIVPVAAGGSDEPSNLTTLCSSHHRMIHKDRLCDRMPITVKSQNGRPYAKLQS